MAKNAVRTKRKEAREDVSDHAPSEADVRLGQPRGVAPAGLGGVERLVGLEKLGITEVAQRAGISVGALSQIERGISSLRVRILWPLAAALGVEPHSLLADSHEDSDLYVVRSSARKEIPVRSEGIRKELLSPPGSVLTGLLVEVEPGGGTDASYSHAGHEFGLVKKGQVELTIDSVVYLLKAGDSFAFKSTLKHAFRNSGKERCEIVWINTTKSTETGNGE